MAKSKPSSNQVTDPISAMLKLKMGLAYLQNSEPLRLLFAPDAIRDATLYIDDPQGFSNEILGPDSKNRTSAYAQISAGGHGAIGTIAAGTLRTEENVELILAAKVFNSTKDEILRTLINTPISIKGGNSINTDFIVEDSRPGTPINIVFESPHHTSIAVVKGQPVLRVQDYGERKGELVETFRKADVCGVLSLKSPFLREISALLREKGVSPKEMVSDVTTGDDTAVMVETLKMIGSRGATDAPPLTLLSMNDEEAVRYAKIAWTMENEPGRVEKFLRSREYSRAKGDLEKTVRELSQLEEKGRPEDELRKLRDTIRKSEETIRICSKKFESEIAQGMEKKWKEDFFEAAGYLSGRLKVPLLFHCKEGSQVFYPNGSGKRSKFVPSVKLKPNAGTLGAGDTMLGAIMLALAVKNRLKEEGAPAEMQFSTEDCLMVANVVTGYRLVHGKVPGNLEECFRWASADAARVTTPPAAWKTGGACRGAFEDSREAHSLMMSLHNARKAGFAGQPFHYASEKSGLALLRAFKLEQVRFSKEPDKAAAELLLLIDGKDAVMARLAMNALHSLCREFPEARKAVRGHLGVGDARLVVMFDLDATLFDSQAARERAGTRAIMKMGLKTGDGNRLDHELAKKLFTTLYSRHADFKAMGFPDFRQVWNSPQMYAAAAAIVRAGSKNGKPLKDREELLLLLDSFLDGGRNPLEDPNYSGLLANKINQLMNSGNYTKRLNDAVHEYVETGLVPYLDARKALSILQGVLGAECYVVTEGQDDVQRQKVEMLGLSDFFGSGDKVLSTGYAWQPWRATAGLGIEGERLKREHLEVLEKYSEALQQKLQLAANGKSGTPQSVQAEKELQSALAALATYKEDQRVFEWVNAGFRKKEKKSGAGAFYSEVLRAISKNPRAPRDAIGSGDYGAGKSSPFIGFMVGDRIDNDLAAMKLVSPEVVPVVMMKGSYLPRYTRAKELLGEITYALAAGRSWDEVGTQRMELDSLLNVEEQQDVRKYSELMPKLEARSLSDFSLFLLSKSTYEGVTPVSQGKKVPPEGFGEADLESVLFGRISKSDAVRFVCEDVVKAIASGPEKGVLAAASYFAMHLEDEHLDGGHANRKAAVKISAAENIALLFESCLLQGPNVSSCAADAARKMAEVFSNEAEEKKTRARCVIAYAQISDEVGPLEKLLNTPPHDLGVFLATSVETALKTVELRKEISAAAWSAGTCVSRIHAAALGADGRESYNMAMSQIIKDMNLSGKSPHNPEIRKQAARAYWEGKKTVLNR